MARGQKDAGSPVLPSLASCPLGSLLWGFSVDFSICTTPGPHDPYVSEEPLVDADLNSGCGVLSQARESGAMMREMPAQKQLL